jgi:hypothetical protein
LPVAAVDEFVTCQQERERHGEIGRNWRSSLVRSARMMLEVQETGGLVWRVMSPGPDLSEHSVMPWDSSPRRPACKYRRDQRGCWPAR